MTHDHEIHPSRLSTAELGDEEARCVGILCAPPSDMTDGARVRLLEVRDDPRWTVR